MKLTRYIFFVIFICIANSSISQTNPKFSPHLTTKIKILGMSTDYLVWIFFKDKGTDIEQKLLEVESRLSPRARSRRLRCRKNMPLVDYYDVPVNSAYLENIKPYIKRIRHKSRWLNAVSANVDGQQLQSLADLNFVKNLEIVHSWTSPKMPQDKFLIDNKPSKKTHNNRYDYGPSFPMMNLINVPKLHDLGMDGSGVLIGLMDSGFGSFDHEALDHISILHTWDFVNGDSIVDDEPGQMGTADHGTAVLSQLGGFQPGILIGPAFNADYILAKTENTDWERHIEEHHWIAAAEWADSLGADLTSTSFGYLNNFTHGDTNYTWQDMDGNTTIITIGADIAAGRGMLILTSAGNYGAAIPPQNTLGAPSDGDSVLAIGGVDSFGVRVNYSSMGPTVDGRIKPELMAMANDVIGVQYGTTNGYFQGVGGTSAACPQAAGVAALVLQAYPSLTNMEVAELLKATADNAANPNNEYGWGVINAFEAVLFYKPYIEHSQHPDTENLQGPYSIEAEITSQFPLISDSINTYFRYQGGQWNQLLMTNIGGDFYQAHIPGPGSPNTVEYYIRAANDSSYLTLPFKAPGENFHFYVGPDTVSPVIVHNPIEDVYNVEWPPIVLAMITDNISVNSDNIFVEWKQNNVVMPNFFLQQIEGSEYSGKFNTLQVNVNDVIQYRIVAHDSSQNSNVSYSPSSGYNEFVITQPNGLVMIIDDTPADTIAKNISNNSDLSPVEQYKLWLQQNDYYVQITKSDTASISEWQSYNLVISISGLNANPLSSIAYRQDLIQYVENGGKLLIEGGEIGYTMSSVDTIFTSKVLHCIEWIEDFAGPLRKVSSHNSHNILNYPNNMPFQISLYPEPAKLIHDTMLPDNASYAIYSPGTQVGKTGILVHDSLMKPKVVYFAFDLASVLEEAFAKDLFENTIEYLMGNQPLNITEEKSQLIRDLKLYPAYPNPFNLITNIEFFLPHIEVIKLDIYNILGQRIQTLISNRKMEAGKHSISWNAQELYSGIYYIHLKSKSVSLVQKVIVLK